MVIKNKFLVLILISLALVVPVKAATVTISQPGADSGTIMKGVPFTITVSGLSGSGTVNLIDLPTGFSTEEGTSKSFSEGTTSVAWTTSRISAIQPNIKIKVSITTAGSPSTAESSSFDVVLPPSISISASPKSITVNQGSSFTVTLNVQNAGGTSAKSISFSVSGTGVSISEGCAQITSVPAEGSASVLCTILASTSGTHTITFIASPSNTDSKSDLITIKVESVGGEEIGSGGGGGAGGGVGGGYGGVTPIEKIKNATKKLELVPGVGLRQNAKLLSTLEKVLGKGKMSEQAIENLLRLSASIVSDLEATRNFKIEENKSKIELRIRYKGKNRVRNFIVYDKIPKTFANSTDLIFVNAYGAKIEIIEKDPEYVFLYSDVSEDDELSILYETSGEKNATIINETFVEFYAESLEITEKPEENITEIPEEEQPEVVEKRKKVKEEKEQPNYLPTIILVIVIFGILGAIYYFKFYKKRTD
ncbi:MAG TPA: DUF4366 domain-containing protein [Candidatus Aenigmarchaeota archaeon]|nr:DUF4366 domain-containing protein [Candidatus Aenigmarchaeota archaeon]